MVQNLKYKIDDSEATNYNYYDSHIKAYQLERIGVQIVTSNALGIPVIETIKPLKSFVDHRIVNM